MKNLEIPRNDSLCALCRINNANETGSHMVPNLLTSVALSFDGKAKRDREIVEKYHLNSVKDNSVYYGRDVSVEKISSDLGHEMTEKEQEDNVNTLCYDHIFCKDCEKCFSVLESAFGEFYKSGKDIRPQLAYLFWLSVFWRMSVGYMSIFMDAKDELNIRDILNKNLKSREEIINSTENLGDYGFAVFRLNEALRKGDSGILGICKPQAPYIILVADYVVIMFTYYSKMHKNTVVFDWDISLDDINTPNKEEYIELDLNIEEFHDFRKLIIDANYGVFNQEQEKLARKIREYERSNGKPIITRHIFIN